MLLKNVSAELVCRSEANETDASSRGERVDNILALWDAMGHQDFCRLDAGLKNMVWIKILGTLGLQVAPAPGFACPDSDMIAEYSTRHKNTKLHTYGAMDVVRPSPVVCSPALNTYAMQLGLEVRGTSQKRGSSISSAAVISMNVCSNEECEFCHLCM